MQKCSLLIHAQNQNFIKDINRYSDLPKRNHRTQECNDFTENFTRELQIPNRSRRKGQKNLLTGNDSYRKTKFKNNDKKNKDDVFQYSLKGTNIYTMGFPEEEEEKELKSLLKGIKAGTPRSGKKDIYPTPEHLQKPRRQKPKRHHNKIVKKINTLKSSEEK